MKDFVLKNAKNMSFLGTSRRKKDGDDSIASFEQVPRSSMSNGDAVSNSKTVELLPIKGEKGLIKRTGERGMLCFLFIKSGLI